MKKVLCMAMVITALYAADDRVGVSEVSPIRVPQSKEYVDVNDLPLGRVIGALCLKIGSKLSPLVMGVLVQELEEKGFISSVLNSPTKSSGSPTRKGRSISLLLGLEEGRLDVTGYNDKHGVGLAQNAIEELKAQILKEARATNEDSDLE